MIRRIISFAVIACVLFSFTACSGQTEEEKEAMFFLKKEVSEEYSFGNKAIANPFMGFAPDADSKKAAEQCSLVYVDITFRELEPEEGVFAYDVIAEENNLKLWREQGKHIVLRFVCDFPEDEDHLDIPDWLYEKIGGDGTHYNSSYGKGFSPNYNNEIFIEYHAKAIAALGNYFGKDNFVCYVELGSLGHWGEWHVDYGSGIIPIPKEDVREKYITPYITAFPNAKMLMRRPFEAASTHGFGLFNDMAGDAESTEAWMEWIELGGDYRQADEKDALIAMPDAWQTAPIGGEFTSSHEMAWMLKTNITETVSLIKDTHTTFLGPKCPISSGNRYAETDDSVYYEGVAKVLRAMGYRLGITKAEISGVSSKGIASVELTWTNDGAAPLYFDLPVWIYSLDSNGNVVSKTEIDTDLSKLLPGKTLKTTVKIDLSAKAEGTSLAVGIVDPLTGKPAVELVNNFDAIDGMQIFHVY